MGQNIVISEEERKRYYNKIKEKDGITLGYIVDQYYAFKDEYGDLDSEIRKFSSNFMIIRKLFAIDDFVFMRKGKNASYSFTFDEAIFVRELYERIKTRKIWGKIMQIKNNNQLGFYEYYKTTESKEEFFEELSFFVEGIVNIVQTQNEISKQTADVSDAPRKDISRHLYAITQYQIIKINNLMYSIKPYSVDDLLNISDTAYRRYNNALIALEYELDNTISKFNRELLAAVFETFIEKGNSGNLLEKNEVLKKLVSNMKSISPVLYSGLTAKNMYKYLNNLEKNASKYIEKYTQEKNSGRPVRWETDEAFLFREIRGHIIKALDSLSKEEFDLLAEDCLQHCFL